METIDSLNRAPDIVVLSFRENPLRIGAVEPATHNDRHRFCTTGPIRRAGGVDQVRSVLPPESFATGVVAYIDLLLSGSPDRPPDR